MLIITLCQIIIYLFNVGLSYEEDCVSEAPSFEHISGKFPAGRLEIALNSIINSSETVFQYLVSVQYNGMESCILWQYNCKSCGSMVRRSKHGSIDSCHNNKISGNNKIVVNFYKFPEELLFAITNPDLIFPDTYYTIKAQAVYKNSYGKIITLHQKLTENNAEAPSFDSYFTEFPNATLKIVLNHLPAPNGNVFQYIVSAQSSEMESCILWVYNCEPNLPKIIIKEGERIDSCYTRVQPVYEKINYYAETCQMPLIFLFTNKNLIKPNTKYTFKAQAVNRWGYGKIISTEFTSSLNKVARPPTIGQFSYELPAGMFKFVLNTIPDLNENNYMYLVTATSLYMKSCILWEVIFETQIPKVKNLTQNDPRIDSCVRDENNKTTISLSKRQAQVLLSITDPTLVLSGKDFQMHTQAVNNAGFGESSPEVSFSFGGAGKDRSDDCLESTMGLDYKGKVSKTKSGLTCQPWRSQKPHKHGYINSDANYCRNQDMSPDGPWCYTKDASIERETCDIISCQKLECLDNLKGSNYIGTQNTTKAGITCQRWAKWFPHTHIYNDLIENYCFNPDDETTPWCYTLDPQLRYDYCDIPLCKDEKYEVCTGKPTKQSSTFEKFKSKYAVDGNTGRNVNRDKCAITKSGGKQYFLIDLRRQTKINQIHIYSSRYSKSINKKNVEILLINENKSLSGKCDKFDRNNHFDRIRCNNLSGRYLKIQALNGDPLTLCEVQCFEQNTIVTI